MLTEYDQWEVVVDVLPDLPVQSSYIEPTFSEITFIFISFRTVDNDISR